MTRATSYRLRVRPEGIVPDGFEVERFVKAPDIAILSVPNGEDYRLYAEECRAIAGMLIDIAQEIEHDE